MELFESHYKVLELPVGASPEEMKQAYRRLIKRWHPDQFAQDRNQTQIAEEKVKQINLAYSTLKKTLSNGLNDQGDRPATEHRKASTHIHTGVRNPEIYYQQASEYVRDQDYVAATDSLRIAIKIDPTFAKAYRYRGFIYSLQGYERRAASDLRKADELDRLAKRQAQTPSPPTPQYSPRKDHGPDLESWSSHQLGVHGDVITSLALRRHTLASASLDGQLLLWNLRTQKQFGLLSSDSAAINAIGFSADGQLLVSGYQNGKIDLWHVPTGSLLRTFQGADGAITCLTFHQPQGRILAGTDTGVVTLWNCRTGQRIQSLGDSLVPISSIQFVTQTEKVISAGQDGQIRIWDLSQNNRLSQFAIQDNPINSTVISPEENQLILAGEDGTIKAWSVLTGEVGSILDSEQDAIQTLAMNSGASRLASGSQDGSICLWKMSDGGRLAVLKGHQKSVTTSLFWEDKLISGSADGTIYIWSPVD